MAYAVQHLLLVLLLLLLLLLLLVVCVPQSPVLAAEFDQIHHVAPVLKVLANYTSACPRLATQRTVVATYPPVVPVLRPPPSGSNNCWSLDNIAVLVVQSPNIYLYYNNNPSHIFLYIYAFRFCKYSLIKSKIVLYLGIKHCVCSTHIFQNENQHCYD